MGSPDLVMLLCPDKMKYLGKRNFRVVRLFTYCEQHHLPVRFDDESEFY